MASGSVRLHLPIPARVHEDPPGGADGVALPDSRGAGAEPATKTPGIGNLRCENGKLLYVPLSGGVPVAVRLVWARPLSGRGGPVSVMLADKKKEIAYADSIEAFSPQSRAIASEELAKTMILPRIIRILEVKPRFGNYYWTVETDMGARKFLLSSPENNTFRPRADAIVIRDVAGNCYEIDPVSGLDRFSLGEMDRAL